MGLAKNTAVLPTMLSPLGKACARMDLTAVHDILLKTGYKDEEGAENEVRRIITLLPSKCLQVSVGICYMQINKIDSSHSNCRDSGLPIGIC